jgi:hypothetical protein
MAEGLSTERLTEDGYVELLDALMEWSRMALAIDLEPLREFVAMAETAAPVLVPTEYARGGGRNLDQQRRFLDAVGEFQARLRDLMDVAAADAAMAEPGESIPWEQVKAEAEEVPSERRR